MASTILLRTISSVADKRIVLQNSNFARPHGVATWTKLRIAFRLSITDSGANITSSPQFAVGLCSGSSNIFLDATTTHWVGMLTTGATWTRFTGPLEYWIPGSGCKPSKRVGTTITSGTTFSATNFGTFEASTATRSVICVDITKGSPNFTMNMFARTSDTPSDVTIATFQQQIEIPTPVITNHAFVTAQTLAVDEGADGTLDHVCLAWDRATPQLEISDLSIVKLS